MDHTARSAYIFIGASPSAAIIDRILFLGMTRPRILWTLAAAALAVSGFPGVQAQGTDPGVAAVVEQSGRYVTAYIEAFSAIVSEEAQEQRLVRANGSV